MRAVGKAAMRARPAGKWAIVCMAFLLLMPLTPARAVETDSHFVGDWYVNTFRIDDSSFNAGDMGMVIRFTIDADGTATRGDPDGSQETGTWTSGEDGMLISWDDGGVTGFMYADGALVSIPEKGGLTLHLEGAPPNAPPNGRPEHRRDVRAGDFDGDWMSVEITAHGIAIPMSELGERVDLRIKGGKLAAVNDVPVDSSVTTEFLASALFIYNPITEVASAMTLLRDGSAILLHLHAPEAYFTLIPVR